MFPPILPKPIMPSCMQFPPVSAAHHARFERTLTVSVSRLRERGLPYSPAARNEDLFRKGGLAPLVRPDAQRRRGQEDLAQKEEQSGEQRQHRGDEEEGRDLVERGMDERAQEEDHDHAANEERAGRAQ